MNLVFFEMVRSKTNAGRWSAGAPRLRPDLFGPGLDEDHFRIFDLCQNLELFAQNPEAVEGTVTPSLGARLFVTRPDLVARPAGSTNRPSRT